MNTNTITTLSGFFLFLNKKACQKSSNYVHRDPPNPLAQKIQKEKEKRKMIIFHGKLYRMVSITEQLAEICMEGCQVSHLNLQHIPNPYTHDSEKYILHK